MKAIITKCRRDKCKPNDCSVGILIAVISLIALLGIVGIVLAVILLKRKNKI